MTLDEYLSRPSAESVVAFASAIGISPDQVRQWRYSHADRKPGPVHAVAIERITSGSVMRWDLRPDDWHLIWPELKKRKDSPKPKAVEA